MTDCALNTINTAIVLIVTIIITVSQYRQQQHLIIAETPLYTNKKILILCEKVFESPE